MVVHNSSSTSLVVKWRNLKEKHFQGQRIGYQIVYNPADAESERNFLNVNYTTDTITLINLTVYTMYAINVSAVSSGGIGPANTAKARTDATGTVVFFKRHSLSSHCYDFYRRFEYEEKRKQKHPTFRIKKQDSVSTMDDPLY